mmetsp:Transcript_31106/g.79243  ORF Transcript_31106/g.79243 Transcript_31106/m.79243 type:complete len:218 (-) Transcript_31106:435-1088(-)
MVLQSHLPWCQATVRCSPAAGWSSRTVATVSSTIQRKPATRSGMCHSVPCARCRPPSCSSWRRWTARSRTLAAPPPARARSTAWSSEACRSRPATRPTSRWWWRGRYLQRRRDCRQRLRCGTKPRRSGLRSHLTSRLARRCAASPPPRANSASSSSTATRSRRCSMGRRALPWRRSSGCRRWRPPGAHWRPHCAAPMRGCFSRRSLRCHSPTASTWA